MLPSDLNFGSPLWLWVLLLLPVLVALFFRAERQTALRLARLIQTPRLRQQLTGLANFGRRRWRYAFLLGGLTGLILTMAQPRWGFETRETHRRGLDLVVIADVSKSMLATDLTPNRLTRMRLSIQDLIAQLQGDRVGLVAFAGTAFLQAPLTIDYDAVLASVAELDTDLIPRGGTNLGGAIDLALEAFGKTESGNRAILLLSDGEPTVDGEEASGVEAARRAAAAGVKVFTVGFGTTEGSLIPLPGGKGDFVRDEDGKIVRTRLDEGTLTEIARAGNGFYLRFTNGEATMRTIIQDGLSQLKAGEIDARSARRPIERYAWPLGIGLVFLVLGTLVGERRRLGAPAGIGGISPDAIAVPVRRTAAVAVILLLLGPGQGARAEDAARPVETDPLQLYREGKYDQAYRAYEALAKKDPKADSLQFDAGASAYKNNQYDEAMDAFGKAMTSSDPALRAKSHYNFGNTLFQRGASQKEPEARLADWQNALQHYDSTLDMLKRADSAHKDDRLVSNTQYNHDLVKKLLDEERKQQQQQQKKDDKKDKQDKKDDKDKKDGGKDKKDGKEDKKDGSQGDKKEQEKGQDGKEQQPQQDGGKSDQKSPDQQGASPSDESGQGSQPPKPDEPSQGGKDANQPPQPDSQSKDPQNQSKGSGKPQPDQPQNNPSQGKGKEKDSEHPSDQSDRNGQTPNGPPDKSDLPDQDKPRERGDFQAKPDGEKKASPAPDKNGEAGQATGDQPEEEPGKMSAAQARALLDALKGDDAHVPVDFNKKHSRDEPVTKDW